MRIRREASEACFQTSPTMPHPVRAVKIETSDVVSDEGDSIAREELNHLNDETKNDKMTATIISWDSRLTKHLKDVLIIKYEKVGLFCLKSRFCL